MLLRARPWTIACRWFLQGWIPGRRSVCPHATNAPVHANGWNGAAEHGEADLREIIEQDGQAELTCQFCHARHHFTREQSIELLEKPRREHIRPPSGGIMNHGCAAL